MGSLLATWRVAVKEYRVALRSSTFYAVVGLPVLVSLGIRVLVRESGPRPARVAVVGPGSKRLARAVESVPWKTLGLEVRLRSVSDRATALSGLRRGRLHGVMVLPEGFWEDFSAGRRPRVRLYYDEAGGTAALALAPFFREVFRVLARQRDPVAMDVEGIRHISRWKALLPAFVVMVLLSALTLMPAGIASERQDGTLQALLAAPLDLWQVVAGKAAFGVGAALGGALVVLAANDALVGNLGVVVLACFLGAAASTLLGILLGLWIDSAQAASAVASFLYVPLVWGAFFADFSGPVGRVARWSPGHLVAGLLKEALFMEASWSRAAAGLAGLAASVVLLGLGAVWALRHEEERI